MGPGPVHKKIILVVLLSVLTMITVMAQITSTTADRVDSLAYPIHFGKDPFFIFYQKYQVFRSGSLTATLPGSGDYNFEWSKYDPDLDGFSPPFSTGSGASSTVADLIDGCYRVRIFNGSGTDTTLTAWVMLDDLHGWVTKDDDNKVPSGQGYIACGYLALSGFVTPDTLLYYDLSSHLELKRPVEFRYKWSSDNQELKIPNDTLNPNITYQPPFEDTWYILTVTDEFNMEEVDSVLYESIETDAQFKVEYLDKVLQRTSTDPEEIWDPDLTGEFSIEKGSRDAKLTVRFINESKNGASYEWVFLDTLGGIRQTETTYSVDDIPEFTYETADEDYYPFLFSTSEAGCVDSMKLAAGISVVKSQLQIPNVFSPNGDGTNDIWRFKHQSLSSCKVTIVDRTGKVVYKREIENIYDWEGWNGNVKESDRQAPEGQYYFVVQASGYDNTEYKDPTIWETMQLFGGIRDQVSQGTGGTTPGTGTEPQKETLYTGWLYLYRH